MSVYSPASQSDTDTLIRPWQGRRRWLLISVWLIVIVVAAPLAAMVSPHLTGGGFSAPGSASATVTNVIARDYPTMNQSPLGIVLRSTPDTGPGDMATALRSVRDAVATVPELSIPATTEQAAAAQLSRGPAGTVVIPLQSSLGDQQAIDAAARLRHQFGASGSTPGSLAGGRVSVSVIGQGALWSAMQDLSEKAAATAELRGFPILALVLFLVFGCLAAMLLPLVLGAASVVTTMAVLYGLALVTEISLFATNVTSMIGIGVAVDYSLFVLARYRQAMADGAGHDQAITVALRTSGRAVYFSGLTVVLSLLTVYVIDSSALRSLALGAIVVVAVAVLATATLLPAMLSVLGPRRLATGRPIRRIQRYLRRDAEAASSVSSGSGFWQRWAAAVMRRPVLWIVVSATLLLVLAAPALQLKIHSDAVSQLPANDDVVVAQQAAAAAVSPGAMGPVYVLVHDSGGSASGAVRESELIDSVHTILANDPAVASAGAPVSAKDGSSIVITALLRADPESQQAGEAVHALRARFARLPAQPGQVLVGGASATLVDFDDLVTSSLPWMFVLILVLAFVVLFVVLRSIVLPLKAICMNLLTVGASYGAVVAAFQWGWLSFLGLAHTATVDTILPPMVLVVAFGLSMDYEVFLLTRIRERYDETGDTRAAVQHAIARSATPITSAALIMFAVFVAFGSSGMPTVQRLGFALAVAVALDATVVRLVLVPAAMTVLGRWNWWLPRPVERSLSRGATTISH